MKFTDRFISVPIKVFDIKQKEITGKEETEDSYEKLDPLQIEGYRPSYDPEFPDKECLFISYKSGNKGSLAYLSIAEFETLLNNWQPESIYQKQ